MLNFFTLLIIKIYLIIMNSVEEVFKILSIDVKFITHITTSINNIMKDGKVDHHDIPEIILLLINAYNDICHFHLSFEDLPILIKQLYCFIINKHNLLTDDKKDVFDKLVDTSIKLVMTQPKVKKQVFRFFSLCKWK